MIIVIIWPITIVESLQFVTDIVFCVLVNIFLMSVLPITLRAHLLSHIFTTTADMERHFFLPHFRYAMTSVAIGITIVEVKYFFQIITFLHTHIAAILLSEIFRLTGCFTF